VQICAALDQRGICTKTGQAQSVLGTEQGVNIDRKAVGTAGRLTLGTSNNVFGADMGGTVTTGLEGVALARLAVGDSASPALARQTEAFPAILPTCAVVAAVALGAAVHAQ